MSASPRLLDDPGTSEKVRADLRRAQLHAVAPFDTAAGLARFRAGLEGAGLTGAGLDGALKVTTPPAAGGALSGSSWKLFAALGVAGVVAWVLLSGTSDKNLDAVTGSRGASASLEETVPRSAPQSGAPTKELVGEADAPSLATPSQGPSEEPRALGAEPRVRSDGATETPNARPLEKIAGALPASTEKSDPISEEIAQLAQLRQLHRTDPQAAILLAKDGHKQFSRGILYEEREALLILSLEKVGESAEAQRRAKAFRDRFPTSAFLSKMRRLSPLAEESRGAAP